MQIYICYREKSRNIPIYVYVTIWDSVDMAVEENEYFIWDKLDV